jgi:hypothetical protein
MRTASESRTEFPSGKAVSAQTVVAKTVSAKTVSGKVVSETTVAAGKTQGSSHLVESAVEQHLYQGARRQILCFVWEWPLGRECERRRRRRLQLPSSCSDAVKGDISIYCSSRKRGKGEKEPHLDSLHRERRHNEIFTIGSCISSI